MCDIWSLHFVSVSNGFSLFRPDHKCSSQDEEEEEEVWKGTESRNKKAERLRILVVGWYEFNHQPCAHQFDVVHEDGENLLPASEEQDFCQVFSTQSNAMLT
jgi:hypothetical protein